MRCPTSPRRALDEPSDDAVELRQSERDARGYQRLLDALIRRPCLFRVRVGARVRARVGARVRVRRASEASNG